MNKGIVFFFEGKFNSWYCTNVSYYEHGIRGYVRDGHWWMDYNTETGIVNVCISDQRVIKWNAPINVMTHLGNPVIIAVEDVAGEYNEIMEWAKTQRNTE